MEPTLFLLSSAGFNPLNSLFGWLTRIFFEFFNSYGLAIIALTILVRGLLIPLNVRSQRSMVKQQALSAQQAEIRRKYPDDKQKQQEEISKLFQENGAASLGGCILPFIQIIFIFPIYSVVRSPLRYITQVSVENLEALGELLGIKGASQNSIAIVSALQNSPEMLRQAVEKGLMGISQMVDMHFLGLDLSLTPQWRPDILFGPDWKLYVPLMIIPLLVLATTLLQTRVTNMLKPNRKEEQAAKEAKARARVNPARKDQAQENSMQSTMNAMMYMMPIIMLVTTFMLPSAMAFYWIVGNVMSILQQVIIFFLFTKPLEAKKAEMELRKAMAFAKSAGSEEHVPATSSNKKKKGNRF
ncbi:MAG: YidC/Oxa1 family membrane protein insertase [Clostridiaceae bacterium]|mgnify:CR=1 FL=1|nr:YidC/Oxa1 family membrane protein insertase [Clostridiaceae bacterium]